MRALVVRRLGDSEHGGLSWCSVVNILNLLVLRLRRLNVLCWVRLRRSVNWLIWESILRGLMLRLGCLWC